MDYRLKTCRSDIYQDANIEEHFNLLHGILRYYYIILLLNKYFNRKNVPIAKYAFLPQLLPSNKQKFEYRIWQEVNKQIFEAPSPKIDSKELVKISVISKNISSGELSY